VPVRAEEKLDRMLLVMQIYARRTQRGLWLATRRLCDEKVSGEEGKKKEDDRQVCIRARQQHRQFCSRTTFLIHPCGLCTQAGLGPNRQCQQAINVVLQPAPKDIGRTYQRYWKHASVAIHTAALPSLRLLHACQRDLAAQIKLLLSCLWS